MTPRRPTYAKESFAFAFALPNDDLAWLRRSGVRAAAIHSGCRQIFKIDPSDHRRQLVRAVTQPLSQSVRESGSHLVAFHMDLCSHSRQFFGFLFFFFSFFVFLIFAISFGRLRLSKIHRCGPQLETEGNPRAVAVIKIYMTPTRATMRCLRVVVGEHSPSLSLSLSLSLIRRGCACPVPSLFSIKHQALSGACMVVLLLRGVWSN